ncbi:MAG: hypothetical protein ABIG84_03690 [archaeon]
MYDLKTDPYQLMNIFPREIADLDVVVPINNSGELLVIYIQKETEDNYRNWDSYNQWQERSMDAAEKDELTIDTPLPDDLDPIYHRYIRYIEDNTISQNDKIVLAFHLYQKSGNIVNLAYIERNMADDFKGIGGECYRNILPWLKDKGYDFLTGMPVTQGAENYWKQKGQVLVDSLPDKEKDYLIKSGISKESFVHLLS